MQQFKQDLFESGLPFTIEEAKETIQGQGVIGKVKGPFFVPDGVSRNNRYYSKDLWEQTLSRVMLRNVLKREGCLAP